MSHANLAKSLVASLPPGVFARAALPAVMREDYSLLEQMLPGVHFTSVAVAQDMWELNGLCADGSVVVWQVGG
jgi:hypothetical protein